MNTSLNFLRGKQNSAAVATSVPVQTKLTEETDEPIYSEGTIKRLCAHPVTQRTVTVRVKITPDLARLWMDRNTDNRPMSESYTYRLISDIREGRWKFDGSPIRFSKQGVLIDGQHRLTACIRSGIPIDSNVTFGLDHEAQMVIDGGRVRTVANNLYLRHVKNAVSVAALARTIVADQMFGIRSARWASISRTKIEEFVNSHPELSEISRRYTMRNCSQSIVDFCYYQFSGQDPQLAARFFGELCGSGAGLEETNPVLHLRNRLDVNAQSRAKLPSIEIIAIFRKAWIAYRDNVPMRSLRWRAGGPKPEEFPEI
jgi:hypothetical protein